MRIYAFTDLHGNTKALAKIKEEVRKKKPDLVICTGDLTVFEREIKALLSRVNLLHVPVLMLHGNHEDKDHLRRLCKGFSRIRFLHNETYEQDGFTFLAYGGEGFKDEDKKLARLAEREKDLDWSKVIILTHAPPYNTTIDDVGDKEEWHVGSKTLRRIIKKYQPPLALSGHLHECFHKRDKIGKSLVANPGPTGELFDMDSLVLNE